MRSAMAVAPFPAGGSGRWRGRHLSRGGRGARTARRTVLDMSSQRSRLSDPEVVGREYASLERLSRRRIDRTAWSRGGSSPWLVALGAIAKVRPKRVLDAGCGGGECAALIAAPEVIGVDLSPAATRATRSRGVQACRADLQHLPFTDASFDAVACNWVLYHLPDRDRGISELARVLSPG